MPKKIFASVQLLAMLVMVASPLLDAKAAIVEPGFETEVVASGLTLPTSMAFAQDGRIFVAEKGGAVRVIENGVLLPTPVIILTDINTFGDRGLLGIATDPNFLTNGYLYVSYTYENTPGANVGGAKTGHIARVTVVGNTADETSKVVLVGTVGGSVAVPSCEDFVITEDCIPSDSPSHSMGGLRFGPDEKLYATLGDGAHFDYADPGSLRAQNIDSLAGKMLRINTDGTAPTDNPFYNGDPTANRSKVYALGLRNAFRFNFNAATGALYAGDVGWSDWEEVNQITSSANFGWPCFEGNEATIHNCTPSSATTSPLYVYPHDGSGAGSITAGAFSANNAYPDLYDTSLFVGDYAQNWMKRIVLDGAGALSSVEDFDDSPNGPVDVSTGIDGMIYYLSIYTGELNRLTHTSGNRRPVPVISADTTSGLLPLTVAFSSAGSYDPDGDALTYEWNFGDGTVSTLPNPSYEYVLQGSYTAVLALTDINGSVATKSLLITAGNQAPQGTITSPASGSLYVPNQVIQLEGSATDLEDGVLAASAYHWKVILHHNVHIHIMQEFDGVISPSFIAPDHSASDVYTEIELTVTDSSGLVDVSSINLYLNNGSSAGNLVANPSLEIANETSGQPIGWHKGWYGNLNAVFTYPVTGLEGAKAAEVQVTDHVEGDAKWYFDPVSVTPGQDYYFSNHYTATADSSVSAQMALSDGTYQYVNLGILPAVAVSTHVERTISVPAGVETMTVFHQIGTNGTLVVDDYELTLATIIPDTIAPSVSITAPSASTTLSGSAAVEVTATDNIGIEGVTLLIDTIAVLSEDTTAPYSFVWDTTTSTDGSHTIEARARDAAGNVATSTAIVIVVDNTPNLVANADLEVENGTSPLNWFQGAWGNHARVFTYPITGYNGQKAARVEITAYPVDGTGDSKWAFDPIVVTPGTEYAYSDHYRSNTISDIIGRYTLSGGGFHYFGLAKEIPPSATWQTITGTFTPPVNATHITFYHLISSVGYIEIDDVDLQVNGAGTPSETNAPIVEFTNPLAGQTVSGIIPITASSTDDTAVTYIFYAVDGIPVTGQITTAPYLFNWDSTTVSNGAHVLKATTHDPFGNNSTHTISFAVDNTIPPPTGDNLIANPSLEIDGGAGAPASWLKGGWGTNSRVFTYPVPGTEGVVAAKVEISSYTNGDAKWYFADVAVTAGAPYTFSEQFKSSASTEVLARYTLAGGGTQYQFLGAVPANPSWTANTYSITPPTNTVSLTIFHVLHSVGTLEIDDYSLTTATVLDITPPTVTITAPLTAETVSNVTNVSADASDSGGVAGVTLIVDGLPVVIDGVAEDTTAPYIFSWDTAMVADGAHTLEARARDIAGNVATSSLITVTVTNTLPPTSNLVLNPSLETVGGNGDPANWFRGGWGNNTRAFVYPVTGVAGDSAARVEISNYVDGDAKWRWQDVAVTGGALYTLNHSYRANIGTNVTVRYTLTNGTFQYTSLGNRAASATWQNIGHTFVTPANAVSMTVMHILYSNGWLEVDDFVLIAGNSNTFAEGMISYTFDDGWLSHYTDALPILDTANIDATFYIVSQETMNPPTEQIANPSLETADGNGNPASWFKGGWGTNNRVHTYPVAGVAGANAAKVEITDYTNGDAKWYFADAAVAPDETYVLSHSYNSSISSELLVRYTLTDGSVQYVGLAVMPSTDGSWQSYEQTITTPLDAVSMTVFHLIHGIGSITIDNFSLKRVQHFVNQSQMLALQTSGHELGGHSRTHPALTTLSTPDAQTEIEGSRNEILAMGGLLLESFAYPFGDYNQSVQTLTDNAGYASARSVDRGYNTKATDKLALKIQMVGRTTTLAEIQGWVAQAITDKTWLILMFHQIDSDLNATLGVTPQFLTDIVNYVNTTSITEVKVSEGVALMNP